jgi:hypothetical protein
MTSDSAAASATQFLHQAEVSEVAQAIFDEDRAVMGFAMNASRLWAYHPEAMNGLLT